MRKLCAILLLSIPMLVFAQTSKLASWQSHFANPAMLGSGDLRWFGFHIYSAKLWADVPVFDVKQKFALELTYQRAISKTRFVSVSLDEMRRLAGDSLPAEQLQRWETYMQQAFLDVKEGEQLIGVHLPGVGCRFYSRDKLLAEILDPAFAQAFFAIWFDARSKDANLRQKLIGGAQRGNTP